ncbi:hypothetical protein BDV09DRAFT_162336 [Aspergillus tetrazonus]
MRNAPEPFRPRSPELPRPSVRIQRAYKSLKINHYPATTAATLIASPCLPKIPEPRPAWVHLQRSQVKALFLVRPMYPWCPYISTC